MLLPISESPERDLECGSELRLGHRELLAKNTDAGDPLEPQALGHRRRRGVRVRERRLNERLVGERVEARPVPVASNSSSLLAA